MVVGGGGGVSPCAFDDFTPFGTDDPRLIETWVATTTEEGGSSDKSFRV